MHVDVVTLPRAYMLELVPLKATRSLRLSMASRRCGRATNELNVTAETQICMLLATCRLCIIV